LDRGPHLFAGERHIDVLDPSGDSASITALTKAAGEPDVRTFADALGADRVVGLGVHVLSVSQLGDSSDVGTK